MSQQSHRDYHRRAFARSAVGYPDTVLGGAVGDFLAGPGGSIRKAGGVDSRERRHFIVE